MMTSLREHAWTAMHEFHFTKEEWMKEMERCWDYVAGTGNKCKPR